MKEHGDGESNTVTRPPQVSHLSTDKLLQDRGHLQHLVSSSIPSPPYPGLALFTPSALFGADPRAMLSAHALLASIQMAANTDVRFQIPISLPLTVQTSPSQLYHPAVSCVGQVGLPTSAHPNAQLNIFSSWVKNDHSTNEDMMKMSSGNKATGLKNKRESNWSVSKANKRNKPPAQMISSDLHISYKKELDDTKGDIGMNGKREKQKDNGCDSGMKSEILPSDKIRQLEIGAEHQSVNNNNIIGNIPQPQQQSNQQSRDKVFICPICSRCFGYKHVLQNHERTHTGEKPFECNICQKKFTRDHHLKTHMRLHTGEKPYQCTHCERLFVQVANLRRHLRVHTGERPYACDLCQSRFSDSNQLKAHMLIHKGEKPYTCPECKGRFRRRHHLIHHKCISKEKSPSSESLPHSPTQDISPPSGGKRERKSRETRRILRVSPDDSPLAFGQIIPEQTHPEDLSLNNVGGIRGRHFSGSHSSCSASPSPPSGGSHGSIGIYCRSITSSDPAEYSSDEDRSVTATSSNNGKTESDEASPHV